MDIDHDTIIVNVLYPMTWLSCKDNFSNKSICIYFIDYYFKVETIHASTAEMPNYFVLIVPK